MSAQSEVCLRDLTKYHKAAARLFTDDGPLDVENLYKGWPSKRRKQRKESFAAAAAQAEVTAGNADSQEIFQAQAMQAMSSMILGGTANQCMVMQRVLIRMIEFSAHFSSRIILRRFKRLEVSRFPACELWL